jgi:hypothetical protein
MQSFTNAVTIVLPILLSGIYLLALYYFIKMIIYVARLPKQLRSMEKRIRELEEKEYK